MMSEDIVVVCETDRCQNFGAPIEIAGWEGAQVSCGLCGTVLAEQAEWYVPPEPDEPADSVETAAQALARLTPEERAALIALLGGAQ